MNRSGVLKNPDNTISIDPRAINRVSSIIIGDTNMLNIRVNVLPIFVKYSCVMLRRKYSVIDHIDYIEIPSNIVTIPEYKINESIETSLDVILADNAVLAMLDSKDSVVMDNFHSGFIGDIVSELAEEGLGVNACKKIYAYDELFESTSVGVVPYFLDVYFIVNVTKHYHSDDWIPIPYTMSPFDAKRLDKYPELFLSDVIEFDQFAYYENGKQTIANTSTKLRLVYDILKTELAP